LVAFDVLNFGSLIHIEKFSISPEKFYLEEAPRFQKKMIFLNFSPELCPDLSNTYGII